MGSQDDSNTILCGLHVSRTCHHRTDCWHIFAQWVALGVACWLTCGMLTWHELSGERFTNPYVLTMRSPAAWDYREDLLGIATVFFFVHVTASFYFMIRIIERCATLNDWTFMMVAIFSNSTESAGVCDRHRIFPRCLGCGIGFPACLIISV
ncbi:putative vacuolar membrane protein [Dirofilaria immitis]